MGIIHNLGHRLLRLQDPETAHRIAINMLAKRWGPKFKSPPERKATLFGREVPNLVGIPGGFDKNAEALDGIFDMGFGFIEVGSITPEPRDGNTFRPRHWRAPDGGQWNAYGLNSVGVIAATLNLRRFRQTGHHKYGLVGASLANPDSHDHLQFFRMSNLLRPYVDFFTVNFSCPNSGEEAARSFEILKQQVKNTVQGANDKPVLVKLAYIPSENQLFQTVHKALDRGARGFIACNTFPYALAEELKMVNQDMLQNWPRVEGKPVGGYSGPMAYSYVSDMVGNLRKIAGPDVTIIASGSAEEREDVDAYIRKGAKGVQAFSSIARDGMRAVRNLLG